MSDSLSFHAWLYDHLAQVFDGTIARWPAPSCEAPDAGALRDAADAVADALASAAPDGTQADHARLLVNAPGGVAAPPYASWYLDGRLLGPSASWVAAEYGLQQVEMARDGGEPPDYLPCELEFMYFLCRHELAARRTADAPALEHVLEAERRFVESHLARWVPPFVERLRAGRPGPVFAAAAELLVHLLAAERHRLANSTTATPLPAENALNRSGTRE